jgi:autotransporter-associated beta strand protein
LDLTALAAPTITFGSLAGSGTFNLGFAAVTVGSDHASTILSGVVQDYGTASLTKVGTGTLTLSGDNTYGGGTIIDAGTLLANNPTGSATGSGDVTVNSGATLGGSGSIAGLTTFNSGAHLAPGNSPGKLTFSGGLTLAGGSILDFQLGTTSDLIRVSGGTLSGPLSGLVTLNLANAGGFTAGTYTLFDFTSAATSSFDVGDFTFGSTLPGYTYALALTGSTLELTATASAIPEPSTYAAIFGAAALALAAYRKRRAGA